MLFVSGVDKTRGPLPQFSPDQHFGGDVLSEKDFAMLRESIQSGRNFGGAKSRTLEHVGGHQNIAARDLCPYGQSDVIGRNRAGRDKGAVLARARFVEI